MSEARIFDAVLLKRRLKWPWAVALAAVVLGGGVLFARRTGGNYRVVTPRGFGVLKPGMHTREVSSILEAGPIARNTGDDGSDCLIYGRPSLKVSQFTVYEVCYRDDALVRLREKVMTAQELPP
jgi:hypothetical protein